VSQKFADKIERDISTSTQIRVSPIAERRFWHSFGGAGRK